jgi:hypothetical protein
MSDISSRTYRQPRNKVFEAALRSVQAAGHRISNIDEQSGLLNFTTQTGVLEGLISKDDGQEMTVLVRDDQAGGATVDVSGQARNRWQLGSDDSRRELAEALFDQMDATLAGAV